jgi:hypothetical protein
VNPALALLRATLLDSLNLWRSAPWLILPAVVAELLQHRAEVKLGMFASHQAFAMLAMAPERWWWGGWKLAAILFAMLAGLWLWCRRDGGQVLWPRLGLAVLLNALAMVPGLLIEGRVDPVTGMAGSLVINLIALPLLPFTVGALAGDADMTLRAAWTRGWWPALRMALLLAAGYLPLQALHLANHTLAMGQDAAPLWTVLAWDSLVVGMMAAWLATALHHGYRGAAAFAKR